MLKVADEHDAVPRGDAEDGHESHQGTERERSIG